MSDEINILSIKELDRESLEMDDWTSPNKRYFFVKFFYDGKSFTDRLTIPKPMIEFGALPLKDIIKERCLAKARKRRVSFKRC